MTKQTKIKFVKALKCWKYSESFRRKIVEEYLKTGKPKLHIQRAHNIKYKSAINKWLKDFGIVDPYSKKAYLADRKEPLLQKGKEKLNGQLTIRELEAKVADLEHQQIKIFC